MTSVTLVLAHGETPANDVDDARWTGRLQVPTAFSKITSRARTVGSRSTSGSQLPTVPVDTLSSISRARSATGPLPLAATNC